MTREEAKRRAEVEMAYFNGESIQCLHFVSRDSEWTDVDNPDFSWDCNDYRVKPKRYRAKEGCFYYYIGDDGIATSTDESNCSWDNKRFELGNYFETLQQAQVAAEEFKSLFSKYTQYE